MLAEMLKKYGFPEADILTDKKACWWNRKGAGCGFLSIMYLDDKFNFCGWDTEIKTESDWLAVAGFVRFLKGE